MIAVASAWRASSSTGKKRAHVRVAMRVDVTVRNANDNRWLASYYDIADVGLDSFVDAICARYSYPIVVDLAFGGLR